MALRSLVKGHLAHGHANRHIVVQSHPSDQHQHSSWRHKLSTCIRCNVVLSIMQAKGLHVFRADPRDCSRPEGRVSFEGSSTGKPIGAFSELCSAPPAHFAPPLPFPTGRRPDAAATASRDGKVVRDERGRGILVVLVLGVIARVLASRGRPAGRGSCVRAGRLP